MTTDQSTGPETSATAPAPAPVSEEAAAQPVPEPAPAAAADAAEQPASEPSDPPEPGPAPRGGTGRRLARGAFSVALAVAVGVGTGLAVLHVEKMRTGNTTASAATPSASASPSYGASWNGSHFGSLSALLLPVPDGYQPGPDVPGIGNDTVLTSDQYKSYFAQQYRELGSTQRDDLAKLLDLSRIKGYAVRTYRDSSGSQEIEMAVLQENQKTADFESRWQSAWEQATNSYRSGPSVAGYPKASCALPPTFPGDKLDELDCAAAVGDLMVTMTVHGPAPLSTDTAVGLFEQQLKRLAIPAQQI